jgi:hypothetical protein
MNNVYVKLLFKWQKLKMTVFNGYLTAMFVPSSHPLKIWYEELLTKQPEIPVWLLMYSLWKMNKINL